MASPDPTPLELFVFPPSPRAIKVMSVANHLGLDWTLRMVDFRRGDHREPEYAALNPNMRMPTMRHGETVMWEANAISQYLALLRPESGLLPRDEPARLDVTRWQFWDLAHLDSACLPYMRENVVKGLFGMGEPDQEALARAEEPFHRALRVLDAQLSAHRFVTGDCLTLADFSLGSAFIHAERAGMPVGPYGSVNRWYADLAAMPSWQKTLAAGGLPLAAAA
jgi:glutathione S-transferase